MLLVVDIGNTNIKFGVFDGNELVKTFRIVSNEEFFNRIFNFLEEIDINNCIISSVVRDLDIKLKNFIDNKYEINSTILTIDMIQNLKFGVKYPDKVGMDRIVNVIGAGKKYTTPIIVIDIGTSTTFDILDKDGVFAGGIIMPGLSMQAQCLNRNTSLLPEIKIAFSEKVIGNDTESAILSGVIRGHALSVEGLIADCEKELGEKATVVGTGGAISIINQYMKNKIENIEPNLTLDGIKEVFEQF